MIQIADGPLSEREIAIFNCIVESYVQTAAPVGSRFLAKRYNLNISPATIRNVMNDLEEMGYLCQPHVSAGRIPTDKGYRFYVNSLVALERLKKRERRIIEDNLYRNSADVNEILDAASRVLGQISSQLGVVSEPRFYQGIFEKMELVSVAHNRLLAVISIRSGLVKTIMMELESEVSREQLDETSRLINERLSGLSLKELKKTIDRRLADVTVNSNRLIRLILESSEKLFAFEDDDSIHVGGASNFVANPEFSDYEDVSFVLGMIEGKGKMGMRLNQWSKDGVSVRIGEENGDDLFRDYSVVTSRYHIGNISGTLGVVGPTRMQYSRIIPLVEFVGDTLTKMFVSH